MIITQSLSLVILVVATGKLGNWCCSLLINEDNDINNKSIGTGAVSTTLNKDNDIIISKQQ